MTMRSHFQQLPKSTVQIYCGQIRGRGDGSGFHVYTDELVVTNDHVIQQARIGSDSIYAVTEEGEETELELLDHSPPKDQGQDYAVLRVKNRFDGDRLPLSPSNSGVERGEKVLFAGFPHGVSDLLVHSAPISGFDGNELYLDGSVNGGNSGGPVVNRDREVIGIVTYSRFVTKNELQGAIRKTDQAAKQAESFNSIYANGDSMGDLFDTLSEVSQLLGNLVAVNANTGIGKGIPIQPVDKKLQEYKNTALFKRGVGPLSDGVRRK